MLLEDLDGSKTFANSTCNKDKLRSLEKIFSTIITVESSSFFDAFKPKILLSDSISTFLSS